jgi:hypothetical protein
MTVTAETCLSTVRIIKHEGPFNTRVGEFCSLELNNVNET